MDRITVVHGGRAGLRRCGACDRQFTVTVGTLFERSKVPLHKWFQAAHLLVSSEKGISAHQLHRTLQVQYKTAWFMEHRLREAMRSGPLAAMGGADSVVEIDETFIGRKQGAEIKQGVGHKHAVRTLVERGGSARSFHVDGAKASEIIPIIRANLDRESHVMTEAPYYRQLDGNVARHDTVRHTIGEYGYCDPKRAHASIRTRLKDTTASSNAE
jgi:hypothetical protein